MRLSKEKIEQIKNEIKMCLVRNPKVSSREIAKILGYDFKFINRLKNEVHQEIAESISHQTLQEEIGKFEVIIEDLAMELWSIIVDSQATNTEKINAIKTLVSNYSLLFDKKFTAGLLTYKPAEEKKHTPEEIKAKIKKIVEIHNRIERVEKELKERGEEIPGDSITETEKPKANETQKGSR
jgi:hypothetical protein